jgi:hypothetical protein
MLFIVGTGRSGTNLIRAILNEHPDIYIATETHFIRTLLRIFGDEEFDIEDFCRIALNHWTTNGEERWVHKHLEAGGRSPEAFRESFREFAPVQCGTVRQFVDAFFDYCYGSGYSWVGDKSPFYGRHIKALRRQWPKAKFIHMVRDGRHAAASMQRHEGFVRLINADFPDTVDLYSYKKKAASYSTERVTKLDCIRFWGRIAEEIRQESSFIPETSYLEVHFENLLLYPLREIVRIIQFLGISKSLSYLWRATQIPQPFKLISQLLGYESTRYDRLTHEMEESLRMFGYSTQSYKQNLIRQGVQCPKEVLNWLIYRGVGRGAQITI